MIPAMFSTSRANSWKSLGVVKLSFVIVFLSLSEKPVVVSVVLSCICTKLFVSLYDSLLPAVDRSSTCGPQQNRLKAPGLSDASNMKDAVLIADHSPIGMKASLPFLFRKKF